MKTTYLLLFLEIFISAVSDGQVITVKQDGSGDFLSIQPAINASQDGDTVLVWPGTYYENINLLGHNITLASLNLITNDPLFIKQTVIDANYSGHCIYMYSGENLVYIQGFTLQRGGGNINGGGLYARDVNDLFITNCNIQDCKIKNAGGGIQFLSGTLHLSGVNIYGNHALLTGGGIGLSANALIIFDPDNRCNLFLNYASIGCDFYKSISCPSTTIILDTATSLMPDSYLFFSSDEFGFQVSDLSFDVLHQKITPINDNIYVNPFGNDSNSGLTPNEALRSISFALIKIISDGTHPNTIFLTNGVYSPVETDEKFPLNIKSYISIQGESLDSTVLDGDSLSYLLKGNNEDTHFAFRNLSIRNGSGTSISSDANGLMNLYVTDHGVFENISFMEGVSDISGAIYVKAHQLKFNYCRFNNNIGGFDHIGVSSRYTIPFVEVHDTVEFINCYVYNHHPIVNLPFTSRVALNVDGVSVQENSMTVNLIGCVFSDNISDYSGDLAASAITTNERSTINIINSTIADNHCVNSQIGYAIGDWDYSTMNIYNSIIYGNTSKQIYVSTPENDPCTLNVFSSVIQGGLEEIYIDKPIHCINYDLTNLDTDPLWDTASMYPYSLSEGSPCIDAGTLDLPPWITLPEFDIAGNPRVWGASVDMGAYEYGPWVSLPENPSAKFKVQSSKWMNMSPNPFSYGTYVSYELLEKGKLNISVYSISGKKVKTLINSSGMPLDAGKIFWDGCDQDGNALPTGTYIIRMTLDDKMLEAVKVVRQ